MIVASITAQLCSWRGFFMCKQDFFQTFLIKVLLFCQISIIFIIAAFFALIYKWFWAVRSDNRGRREIGVTGDPAARQVWRFYQLPAEFFLYRGRADGIFSEKNAGFFRRSRTNCFEWAAESVQDMILSICAAFSEFNSGVGTVGYHRRKTRITP